MTSFKAPLRPLAPLDSYQRFEFSGWLQLIASEIEQLLAARDKKWLNAVALQIYEVLTHAKRAPDRQEAVLSRSLARSVQDSPLHPDDIPGEILEFAALEPDHAWPGADHRFASARWERFAVFALWKIRDAAHHLPRHTEPGESSPPLLTTLYEVDVSASLTIEAMRALQLAHVLKYQAEELSKSAQAKANKRHEHTRRIRAQALEYAKEGRHPTTREPFKSRAAAARAIASLLTKPDSSSAAPDFFTERSVEKWLVDAGWQPTSEMKAEWKIFDQRRKNSNKGRA